MRQSFDASRIISANSVVPCPHFAASPDSDACAECECASEAAAAGSSASADSALEAEAVDPIATDSIRPRSLSSQQASHAATAVCAPSGNPIGRRHRAQDNDTRLLTGLPAGKR
jgi:hypothetical protein